MRRALKRVMAMFVAFSMILCLPGIEAWAAEIDPEEEIIVEEDTGDEVAEVSLEFETVPEDDLILEAVNEYGDAEETVVGATAETETVEMAAAAEGYFFEDEDSDGEIEFDEIEEETV